MGHDCQPISCYCFRQDGEPILLPSTGNIEDMAITLKDEGESTDPLIAEAVGSWTFEICIPKIPKGYRCSTRKRFIKLLMSEGCSKSLARELASNVSRMQGRVSYQDIFFEALGLILAVQAGKEHNETRVTK